MFLTAFRKTTHLRFATFELVRGEWRTYDFNLNSRGDAPAQGELDVSVVNIEENATREPVNYVLPPECPVSPTRPKPDYSAQRAVAGHEAHGLNAGDARGIYRNTQLDLRNYRRMQMWVHAEALIDNATNLRSGEMSVLCASVPTSRTTTMNTRYRSNLHPRHV